MVVVVIFNGSRFLTSRDGETKGSLTEYVIAIKVGKTRAGEDVLVNRAPDRSV